jgi:hypothetical protein
MHSKYKKYLPFLLLFVCFAGCDPTRFSVLSDRDVDCRIYSDHRLVAKMPSGFTLSPGGCVSTTYLWATQYRSIFRITLDEGEGVQIMLRPIVEESILDSGIVLTLTRNGYQLINNDTVLAAGALPVLAQGKTETFSTYSEEGYMELTLGCDTLYRGITKRIEGDDIIFSSLPASTVTIFAPDWRDLELELLRRERIYTGTK